MNPLFKKMNLKDQTEIFVLNTPASVEPDLATLTNVTIFRNPAKVKKVSFLLAFVTTPQDIDTVVELVTLKTEGDVVIWCAYPKGTSKRYRCEINRDTGWQGLGNAGFEPVRQVAIDEDWSAIRFRRVEFIKTMQRRPGMALSEQGKSRTGG